jgi:hypothetical protein
MAVSSRQPLSPTWLFVALSLVAIGYLAGIVLVVWQHLYLPVHDDEIFYSQRFVFLQSAGWRASLAAGDPGGYYAIVRLAGGDANFLFAGRTVSLVSTGFLFMTVWRLTSRMVSPLARAFAVLAILNLTLAGHGFMFMATTDSLFILVIIGGLLAVERAARSQRATDAVIAGVALALGWAIRPLAAIYSVAIVIGIGVLLVRDPRRALTLRFAAVLLSACAAGVLVQQAPAIAAHGRLAFENKNGPGKIWAELKYLSRMKFEERGGSLIEWLKVPVLRFRDVDAYKAEHGAQSLPSTRWQQLRWSPRRTIRDFFATLSRGCASLRRWTERQDNRRSSPACSSPTWWCSHWSPARSLNGAG